MEKSEEHVFYEKIYESSEINCKSVISVLVATTTKHSELQSNNNTSGTASSVLHPGTHVEGTKSYEEDLQSQYIEEFTVNQSDVQNELVVQVGKCKCEQRINFTD